MTPHLVHLSMLGLASALAFLSFEICRVPMMPADDRGARGHARSLARESQAFRLLEPLLRTLASHVARLPVQRQRTAIDKALVAAGEFHGLGPDEFIVLSFMSFCACAGAGNYFMATSSATLLPMALIAIGPFLPWLHLDSCKKERHKSVQRGLPAAIDLAALCMGAGLDFPGAIRHVVANMPRAASPVRDELSRILQELSLGRTRTQALRSFAERVNTDAVREFVAAVVQSESKGTPLSEVLAIQAEVLRNRRSVMAEEAAARAGVMLMLPMLMVVVSVILLVMGPLFVGMAQGEML